MIPLVLNPDPPPAAVRLHRHATVDWAYTFEAPFGPWRVKCFVPPHGPKRCRIVGVKR